MHDTDRFNLAVLVRTQPVFNSLWIHTAAPVCFQKFCFQPQITSHFMPETRKVTGFNHQHQITFCQQIHQRGFPGPCTRGRVYHNMTFCFENRFYTCQTSCADFGKIWPAVVNCGIVHCAQNAIRHITWPGYLQKMFTSFVR